jgi:hypothetical protein
LFEGPDLKRDDPENAGHGAALIEQISPEARDALDPKGKVEFEILLKPVLLGIGQDAVSELFRVRSTQGRNIFQGLEVTMKTNARRGVGGDVEVGPARIDHPLQQFAECG